MNFKSAAAAVAVTATAALGFAAPAHATSSGTGCPKGYDLVSVDYVLTQAAPGFQDKIIAADANHDGLLCYKLLPDAIPLFQPTFLYEDNVVPVGS